MVVSVSQCVVDGVGVRGWVGGWFSDSQFLHVAELQYYIVLSGT
jgi:hypothetical protein